MKKEMNIRSAKNKAAKLGGHQLPDKKGVSMGGHQTAAVSGHMFGLSARGESVVKIIGGAALVGVAAQLAIPLYPVPITLQTMAIMLIALVYRPSESLATIITYVGAGLLGAPVFAHFGFGAHTLFGPTGGYIIGFVAAVAAMGNIKERWGINSGLLLFVNAIIGTAIIFAFGLAWLSLLVGPRAAITAGLLPFLLSGVIKAALLTLALRFVGLLKK